MTTHHKVSLEISLIRRGKELIKMARGNAKKFKPRDEPTLEEYTESIPEDGIRFYWGRTGVRRKAHGDKKSSTGGVFQIRTMETSESPPQYVVYVQRYNRDVVAWFSMGTSRPSDKDVVRELKKIAGVA